MVLKKYEHKILNLVIMEIEGSREMDGVYFSASIEQTPCICQCITDAAHEAGMDDSNLWKLETAVDEACTNICNYGYQGQGDGKIWVRWESSENYFIVTLEDAGIPFDQTEPTHPDLTCDICQRQIGGLGRHIMRNFLDDMRYRREGDHNILELIKELHSMQEKAAM